MKFILLLVACLTFLYGNDVEANSDLPDMNFKFHYNQLSEKRHPNFKNGTSWRAGRKYVRAQFQKYGLRNITEQTFSTSVNGTEVEGVNIIGLMEGADKFGPIILVGADYDTSIRGNQHKDNTGGVASLLEVIHLFCDRVYWNPNFLNYTVIFVAFDLNTKEYRNSGMGEPGSKHFIHEWLLPYMNEIDSTILRPKQKSEFGGAIILDSITTYNMEPMTQTLREGFEESLPSAYEEIEQTNNVGDFLGFLYTKIERNNSIIKSFTRQFNKNVQKTLPFRLQQMELEATFGTLASDVSNMIDHQSHFYFWTNTKDKVLPAFLLFDTDEDRKDPDQKCELSCSVDEFLTNDRIQFMEHTTTAVWETLLDLQTSKYTPVNASSLSSVPAIIMIFVSLLCSTLLYK